MTLDHDLDVCFRSRVTLVCIVSYEEERVAEEVRRLCERTRRALYVWDHADFLQVLVGEGPTFTPPRDPLTMLEAFEKVEGDAVLMLHDFHQCWAGQPRVVRKLRNVAQRLKYARKTILVTLPAGDIPHELRDVVVRLDVPPPDIEGLGQILNDLAANPNVKVELAPPERTRLLNAALGLSSNQAQRVFAKAIVTRGVLDERDLALVLAEKKQIIRESGALEFFTPSETIEEVGGLEVLKAWLRQRERAFTDEARAYGLPVPKGLALIGIPGTGKSLAAKMIAALWQVPLIRLDVGALFGSLVGQSEENTRRALTLAETVAPCLLWIDEIEKALATGDGDSGTSQRVFGSVLSWMQEKTRAVFVVATANNIARLPPELLRRGRFDEVFFLDLPTARERREIFEVHLRKRRRSPEAFDLDALVTASEGHVGAEIEQAIIDAMFAAFSDAERPGREFTTADVSVAIARQVPLSRSQRETIHALRAWLGEGRAQSASFKELREARAAFVPIQVETRAKG